MTMGKWTWEELRDGDRPDGSLALNAYLCAKKPKPTGISKVDQLLGGGLMRGVTVIGGGPSAGKTAIACHAAAMMAASGEKVIYASYETAWDVVQMRCASAWSVIEPSVEQVNWSSIVSGKERDSRPQYDGLDRSQLSHYTVGNAMDPVTRTITMWDEGPGLNLAVDVGCNTVEDLCRVCSDVTDDLGRPPVLIVDYLQIMPTDDSFDNENERLSHVMGCLREYAYSSDEGHVIALSSLRKLRPTEIKDGPDYSWFRGSAQIGYDAEQALIIMAEQEKDADGHWQTKYANNGAMEGRLTVLKNRTGPPGWSMPTLLYGWCSYLG